MYTCSHVKPFPIEEEQDSRATDLNILFHLLPRGIGVEMDDKYTGELKKNPDSISKDLASSLAKKKIMSLILPKIKITSLRSLPNVIRATVRLLALVNGYNKK